MLEDTPLSIPVEGFDDSLPELSVFLDCDPHPTFIIPIDSHRPISFRLRFANRAFLRHEHWQTRIAADDAASAAFRAWAQALAHWRDVWDYEDCSWSAFTLHSKWKVIRMLPGSERPRISRQPSSEPKQKDVWDLQREASLADAQLKSLRCMMEMSDVGVFEYDLTGTLMRGSESWYKLSNHPRDLTAHQDFSFVDLVYPADVSLVISRWNKLLQKEPVTFEMRWKAPPRPSPTNPEIMEDFQWVLSACVPILDDAGELISIAGNTIDISAQKRIQEVQGRRIEEALEAKRQAQNFIANESSEDMTSHEVVDDILTLSKLDSNLILVTPVRVQPVRVVQEGIKIVSLECAKDDIELEFREDPSLQEVGGKWSMMDSSRFLQVLLNLLTNATKFTRDRPTRKITVSLGASFKRPPEIWDGVKFAPSSNKTRRDIRDDIEWGHGRKVYLWLEVDDTGVGLTEGEQSHLFTKFSQASPRTHVTYGGSGLGLFISKSLAEMHGRGCIGVRSQSDIGSTFAFFIGIRVAMDQGLEEVTGRPMLRRQQSIEARQKVLAQQLRRAGCIVHVAGHGKEALDFLTTTRFWRGLENCGRDLSVILMDIEMPVMDGITACKEMRKLQHTGDVISHVPIISVSANARSGQVSSAREAGMDDSISKPFRLPELLPKIETLAKKWD
ncbi:hypothetical protein Vi05172_g1648 [Venturia inaequalis]|nr:hypothetical protein Vi05172_g1648 [Venturia inaequalis]